MYQGLPARVAQSILTPTMERGIRGRGPQQDISYQPGGAGMAGGWGNPGGGAPGMGGGLTPDMLKRIQLYQMLMQNRGAGGMVNNPLTQAAQQMNPQMPGQQMQGQQGGGLMAMIMQNPQLLQWFMQQQQGGPGAFPQGGGGVTLAQLLGAPQGQPT